MALLVGCKRSAWLLAAAGLAFGVGFFARPFDALLFALPFVAVLAWRLRDRRALARTAGLVRWAPIPALDLAYNARTMGSPLTLPFTVTGPLRHHRVRAAGRVRRPHVHLQARRRPARPGQEPAVVPELVVRRRRGVRPRRVAVVAVRSGWRRAPWVWALAGVAAVVCLGYVFFWSPSSMSMRWPGVQTLGPFYHLAVLVPVAILGRWASTCCGGARAPPGASAWPQCWPGWRSRPWGSRPRSRPTPKSGTISRRSTNQVAALGLTWPCWWSWSARLRRVHVAGAVPREPSRPRPAGALAEDRRAGNFELFDRFAGPAHLPAGAAARGGRRAAGTQPGADPAPPGGGQGPDARPAGHQPDEGDPHVVAYITDGRNRKTQLVDGDSTWAESYDVSWPASRRATWAGRRAHVRPAGVGRRDADRRPGGRRHHHDAGRRPLGAAHPLPDGKRRGAAYQPRRATSCWPSRRAPLDPPERRRQARRGARLTPTGWAPAISRSADDDRWSPPA